MGAPSGGLYLPAFRRMVLLRAAHVWPRNATKQPRRDGSLGRVEWRIALKRLFAERPIKKPLHKLNGGIGCWVWHCKRAGPARAKQDMSKSIYETEVHPWMQAGVGMAGALGFMVVNWLMGLGGVDLGERFPWTAAGAFLLMYTVFNSLNSFNAKSMMVYYRNSMFGYMAMLLVVGFLAQLFSQLSIFEAGTYRWIFIMITVSYFGFIGISSFIRFIFMILQREEDNFSKRIDEE